MTGRRAARHAARRRKPASRCGTPAEPVVRTTASIPAKTRFLALGIGKSVVIDLPRDAKDVLVGDPKIANAVIRSSQRAYVIGAGIGQTNVVFFDADGQQIAAYDIAIKRDLNGVRAALHQILPGVQIEGVGEGVVLTGSVTSPVEAQQAGDIAARLVGGADKVVNSIVVKGRDQVMLKVHRRRSPPRHHQADGHRSLRQHECRHRGRELQQQQSVHRARLAAGGRQRPAGPCPWPRACRR